MHGEGRLRRISSDSESTSVSPGEEEWAASQRAPAAMLVNISFVLILMEFQLLHKCYFRDFTIHSRVK